MFKYKLIIIDCSLSNFSTASFTSCDFATMHMFVVQKDSPWPNKLFSGDDHNILDSYSYLLLYAP